MRKFKTFPPDRTVQCRGCDSHNVEAYTGEFIENMGCSGWPKYSRFGCLDCGAQEDDDWDDQHMTRKELNQEIYGVKIHGESQIRGLQQQIIEMQHQISDLQRKLIKGKSGKNKSKS